MRLLLPVVLGLSLVACGPERRGPPMTDIAFSAAATRGQTVFMGHCNQCHPRGQSGLAFAINDKPLPGGLIAFQVRHGLGAMPAFDRATIPDAELDDLVTYLLELRRERGEGLMPRTKAAITARGARWNPSM